MKHKLVLSEAEKLDTHRLFSEEYVVKYYYVTNGFQSQNLTATYYTELKHEHEKVKARFVQDYPKAIIISIIYQ